MAAMRVDELMTGKSSPPSTIMQARIAVPECGKRLEDTLRAANKTLLASLPDLAVLLRLARRAALGFVSGAKSRSVCGLAWPLRRQQASQRRAGPGAKAWAMQADAADQAHQTAQQGIDKARLDQRAD